jgi:hypothetical protein
LLEGGKLLSVQRDRLLLIDAGQIAIIGRIIWDELGLDGTLQRTLLRWYAFLG